MLEVVRLSTGFKGGFLDACSLENLRTNPSGLRDTFAIYILFSGVLPPSTLAPVAYICLRFFWGVLQQHETLAPVQPLAPRPKSHILKNPGPGAQRLKNPKRLFSLKSELWGQQCLETLHLLFILQNLHFC
jgi:hypothetical protein